jgi:hypothetical protein
VSLEREHERVPPRRTSIPWWPIATATLLTAALVLSATAGRVVPPIVIAILLAPTLVFLAFYIWAWRRRPL